MHTPFLFLPSLGPMEIFIIFIVVLILFGPGKLPQVFGALGDGVKQFKKASKDVTDELSGDVSPAESEPKAAAAPSNDANPSA